MKNFYEIIYLLSYLLLCFCTLTDLLLSVSFYFCLFSLSLLFPFPYFVPPCPTPSNRMRPGLGTDVEICACSLPLLFSPRLKPQKLLSLLCCCAVALCCWVKDDTFLPGSECRLVSITVMQGKMLELSLLIQGSLCVEGTFTGRVGEVRGCLPGNGAGLSQVWSGVFSQLQSGRASAHCLPAAIHAVFNP